MQDWNVVLTSFMDQERRLLQELAPLGEFRPSGFREVIVGKVPDVPAFLETLQRYLAEKPFWPQLFSTVMPFAVVFPFTLDNLVVRLKEAALNLASEMGDQAFYVRMKRRGHKGELSSQEIEQTLDQYLMEELTSRGRQCRIDFTNPDVILVVATIHNQCGLGLVTREMKERYPFIKVK